MNNDMILRYLYFLTRVSAGTEKWKVFYDAWNEFSDTIDNEEYERMTKDLRVFNKKYSTKKKEI